MRVPSQHLAELNEAKLGHWDIETFLVSQPASRIGIE